MKPTIHSIRIVGAENPATRAAVQTARRLFPRATLVHTAGWDDGPETVASSAGEILILASPTVDEIERAASAVDARGWPRWAVVVSGAEGADGESHLVRVNAADWNETALGAAMLTAVRLQEMKAQVAKLCGDLRTISRRLGHDVRSPLNCISTAGEAMKEPEEPNDSPRSIFAQSISNSVDEVVHLVDRISFILKATANPLPSQPVVMEEIVWGASQRLESRMNRVGATFTKAAKWPIVEGVPSWLDTIWTNLLTNSLDHGGPNLKIEAGWDQLAGECRFWIRDNGRGVPANRVSRLFHPLDRLSELNAPRGFGLSIVHRLVELQGGRSGYEPGPGTGGTFFFTLPTPTPPSG